jgi:hypothetical protein
VATRTLGGTLGGTAGGTLGAGDEPGLDRLRLGATEMVAQAIRASVRGR